jgi:hypothetical protein
MGNPLEHRVMKLAGWLAGGEKWAQRKWLRLSLLAW